MFFVGQIFGFLEERLTCVIDGKSVIVSMDKEFTSCQSYLLDVDQAIEKVLETRETIGIYIDAERNIAYWQPLYDQMVTKENQLISFRTQINHAMILYESQVFDNIKPVVLAILEKNIGTCRTVWPTLSDVNTKEGSCWQ
jgi:hypothetical protein